MRGKIGWTETNLTQNPKIYDPLYVCVVFIYSIDEVYDNII